MKIVYFGSFLKKTATVYICLSHGWLLKALVEIQKVLPVKAFFYQCYEQTYALQATPQCRAADE